ncbi:MAG: methyltransferase domain-containing protein [Opitutaceae bacterium]|nr:methyltransferase domain-containing protein [Opitutaceae bacterium]
MALLDLIHGHYIFERRTRVLSQQLAAVLPESASVLDVGCGDGLIAKRILALRPDLRLRGLDVFIRPQTHVPVDPFDGQTLPYADHSIDCVMFVDVLHHTPDPTLLLREAARVSRHSIVLKDHACEGLLARPTLRLMDWVGNARHGVVLPYNYWTLAQWRRAFANLRLQPALWHDKLKLYAFPLNLLFERRLHFITRLDVATRSA